MCVGISSPTSREGAKYYGGMYRPEDEFDKKLTEKYSTADNADKTGIGMEIKKYREERAENEKAPRPSSAQTTDENIEPKVKKKKEALGAMVKAKDRDTILSSTIKADRNTLG